MTKDLQQADTISFTMQDGAAPYVKAEYNKCPWGKKCPTLLYRLVYKPMYKVTHKTITELEWRCCPGYSGYGCMEGHPVYQHPVRMMPPFQGPPVKGQHYNSPMSKGPPVNAGVKANPWSQPKRPPLSSFKSYPIHQFGLPKSSSYPHTFESYHPEPAPIPEQSLIEDSQEHQHGLEHGLEHEHSQGPEEMVPEEIPHPSNTEQPEAIGEHLDRETDERLYQIEEDVRRLSQGLETLRGTVNGLEDSLRASLREDANRMLSALLAAAPAPVLAPALASSSSTVGFAEIPAGHFEKEVLDGRHVLPGFSELNARVEELKTELQTKTAALHELKATVTGHDVALKKISGTADVVSDSTGGLEMLIDGKLSTTRAEILGGFSERVENAESRCEEIAGDERLQCLKEQEERQEQMGDALQKSTTNLRTELRNLQAQIRSLKTGEGCCSGAKGLVEQVQLLETSVSGLNQSQKHMKIELGGHKDHIEGILEGRLAYIESKLNLTTENNRDESLKRRSLADRAVAGQALEARIDCKLKALENRLLEALEELGNATAPALLEGHAVPTLETELESLRGRLEVDMDRVQKQLSSLEIRCSSSCSATQKSAIQNDDAASGDNVTEEQIVKQLLDLQHERLNSLNVTLQKILQQLTIRNLQEQSGRESPIQGELTILKFNVRSVNRTLTGLHNSLGTVVQQVGQANISWHERETRLAQQIKGVVQLVGHQASMLGVSERRLSRLRGELQQIKKRLEMEVQGCRSTAMVVKKEVTEVGDRVASVEDQCKGLNYLAEDMERIREELEGQSNDLLLKVNCTLTNHAQQLSELKVELRNCTSKVEPTKPSLEDQQEDRRGDTFTLT
ncbi:EMILIN-3 isoform X2 [Gouania willdenowi]|uniref:EMILIN-3 isoform X2 n=1 Tax=Gouania willdenowi TaxID=441366 RepID=UPI0010553DA9|nr:EMILIN-3-like isoform X2 [Gouania willdenowi]